MATGGNRRLFAACRVGDLAALKTLLEVEQIDPNIRDEWDGTPLYYACLCGHARLVEHLLAHGAACDADTFDGERCHFAALNDEIRARLATFHVVDADRLVVRQLFEEFLRKSLDGGEYSDFYFKVGGRRHPVHKCVLSARSPYFAEAFQSRWQSHRSTSSSLVESEALQSVLSFLYTGRLKTSPDQLDDCIQLAGRFRLAELRQRLVLARHQRVAPHATDRQRKFALNKATVSVDGADLRAVLRADLAALAEQVVPVQLRSTPAAVADLRPSSFFNFADVCFAVDGVEFRGHKMFFAGRSDYFAGLFRDHFGEKERRRADDDDDDDGGGGGGGGGGGDVDFFVIQDVAAAVFAQVVRFVYADTVHVTADTVYDLLDVSEMYLMAGLKKLCAEHLAASVDVDSAVQLLVLARTFSLAALEKACLESVAHHIQLVDSAEFQRLVCDDAAQVRGRQETDTIAVVDDLRYYVSVLFGRSAVQSDDKNRRIDDMLFRLGLEA